MRLFHCPTCQQRLFFESVTCTSCDHRLVYVPGEQVITSVEFDSTGADGGDRLLPLDPRLAGRTLRRCQNDRDFGVCNWAIEEEGEEAFCRSCRLNKIIPNLSVPQAAEAWRRLESAKRRLLYSLLTLGLPFHSKAEDSPAGLAFAFLADEDEGNKKHFTGHKDGIITINILEADDATREKTRQGLGEAYRTLLGHFRHEVGHYYWDRLIRDDNRLDAYRAVFGDERADYQAAMRHHYESGPPADWAANYVSAYATMHPWEDWAETWAHYLHMVDSVETATWHGMVLQPDQPGRHAGEIVAAPTVDFSNFASILRAWLPLTVTLNSLNRGMGLPDLYPFVLSEGAIRKLQFVHQLIGEAGHRAVATNV